MTLEQLIEEGEAVRRECSQDGMMGKFVTGEKYELWMAKCILFLEKNKTSKTLEDRFKEASKNAAGNSDKHLNTMQGILKAIKESE